MTRDLKWDSEEWSYDVKIHAILMLLGWGFFLPVSIMASLLLRHRNRQPIYPFCHIHVLFSMIGLILATAGFAHGIKKFSLFPRKEHGDTTLKHAHAIIGTIAMTGTVLQPFLFLFMRKTGYNNDGSFAEWPMSQKIANMGHRVLGFTWLAIAFVTMGIGTHMASVGSIQSSQNQRLKYTGGFFVVLCATALMALLMWFDKIRFLQRERNNRTIAARKNFQVTPHENANLSNVEQGTSQNYGTILTK